MDHFQRACSQARECRSQRLKDDALKEAGYQQNEFCLHPDDFPLFEPFTGGVPQDAMHTLYCKLPLRATPPNRLLFTAYTFTRIPLTHSTPTRQPPPLLIF